MPALVLPHALTAEPARPRAVREHRYAPWLAVATICFGAFMGQLDASIVTLAFPALQRAFGAGLAAVQWVSLAYLLVLVALLVPVGRWSDRFGRKLAYLYGFGIFGLASAGCGLAPTAGILIGCRVVQAVGAALLQANSVALVSTSVPAVSRRRALGVQAVAQAAGLAFGPAAGGLIVATAGWRWVFLVNPPVALIAGLAGVFLLPRTRQRAEGGRSDLTGAILLAVAVAGLLAVASAAAGLRIGTAGTLALTGFTLAAAAALWWRERRTANPLISARIVAAPGVAAGLAGALAAYLVLFAPLVLYPQVLGTLAARTDAGFVITALPAGFACGAVLAERLLPASWSHRRRCGLGGGLAVTAAGVLALALPVPLLAVMLGVLGAGLGIYLPASNAGVMAAVPEAAAATAGGMVNMARGIGTALGVAIVAVSLHVAGGAAVGARLTMIVLACCAAAATAASVASRRADRPIACRDMITNAVRAGEPARESGSEPELSETVARLRRAMRRTARAADPANTLTVAQLELLASLAENPGSRPGELARRLHLAPNTVTTLINALAPRGLLVRRAAQDDRRAVTIDLTPDGERAVRTWQAVNAGILDTAVATLPVAQRRALTRAVPALDALARAIDRLADSPS